MDQSGGVRLSFVIPVRDDAVRLARCLASVRGAAAAHRAIEVIVVDNESSDGSADVARAHGAEVLVAAGRVAALRNLGARHAQGELLAFVDADHEIAEGWIDVAFDALTPPDVAAAGAPYLPPPDANWVQRQYDAFRVRSEGVRDTDWLGSGNLVVRRDLFLRLGGFDTALETCEDVDLCNRLCAGPYRLVSDSRLASVHLGDPASLRSLFFGELWRGRDNLRVTLRGPRTVARLRSLVVPAVDLLCIIAAVVAFGAGAWRVAAGLAAVIAGLAAVRAAVMISRQPAGTIAAPQSLAVALVYDVARALALAAGGSHRFRRTSEHRAHATPDPRS